MASEGVAMEAKAADESPMSFRVSINFNDDTMTLVV